MSYLTVMTERGKNKTMKLDKRNKKKREENKSERGMPRLLEAKKDVVSCEKLRGTANRF